MPFQPLTLIMPDLEVCVSGQGLCGPGNFFPFNYYYVEITGFVVVDFGLSLYAALTARRIMPDSG